MDNPGWIPSNSFLDMVNPGVHHIWNEWLSYCLDNAILQLLPVSVFAYKERRLRVVGSLLVLIEMSDVCCTLPANLEGFRCGLSSHAYDVQECAATVNYASPIAKPIATPPLHELIQDPRNTRRFRS